MTVATGRTPGVGNFTDDQLLRTLRLFAGDPELPGLLDLTSPQRQRRSLAETPYLQVWLISWPVGSSTGWHDHTGSRGAHLPVLGGLTEHTWLRGEQVRPVPDDGEAYGGSHVHEVSNLGDVVALSLHAYAPALGQMNRYAVREGQLELVEPARAR